MSGSWLDVPWWWSSSTACGASWRSHNRHDVADHPGGAKRGGEWGFSSLGGVSRGRPFGVQLCTRSHGASRIPGWVACDSNRRSPGELGRCEVGLRPNVGLATSVCVAGGLQGRVIREVWSISVDLSSRSSPLSRWRLFGRLVSERQAGASVSVSGVDSRSGEAKGTTPEPSHRGCRGRVVGMTRVERRGMRAGGNTGRTFEIASADGRRSSLSEVTARAVLDVLLPLGAGGRQASNRSGIGATRCPSWSIRLTRM